MCEATNVAGKAGTWLYTSIKCMCACVQLWSCLEVHLIEYATECSHLLYGV